ncbi:DUF3263 domain-containing protein [Mycobacterium sp. NPDC050041]|uniref:DUF3263 domain-containing protein n=1 Tax=Mycobacterium sp. NPDC050041 TaxID=3364293 RepID=UPI003C2C5A31
MDSLTEREQAMLDLEADWYATGGGKEAAIDKQLGLGAVRYYQLLNRLITRETALAYDPLTVNRLRRIAAGEARPLHSLR